MSGATRAAVGRAALLLLLVLAPLLFFGRDARADDPDFTATVDTQRLGVGEIVRLSVHAAARQSQPNRPAPGTTRGFTIVGSSSSPSQQVTITNGRMVAQRGLDAAWSLRADKVGTWWVGPVTMQIGSDTYRAGPIKIVVVPAGQGPQRVAPDPFDPFGQLDPFKSLMDQLNGQGGRGDVSTDSKLSMDAPLGSIAFLHAIADKTEVVVGQQVTVSMYLYVDTSARDPGMVDIHEATAPDFVKKPLFEDDSNDRAIAHAVVGERLYNVRLLRKWALFPLKAGDLLVTPMELTLQRNRATGDPSRKSEALSIHVTAPPLDHRPPGYQLGDVGKWALGADVTPRDVEEDGAIGVSLTISGTGNLPSMITPPAQAGIEWLPPEVHEKVGAQKGDQYGGSRTFTYVVRVHKTGDVKLGWIRVPFWDPSANKYDMARADLGTVTVHPSATPKAKADLPPDPFSALPDVRAAMGGNRPPRTTLAEAHPALFWLALTGTPVAFLLFSSASWAARTLKERRAERAASPETELKTKLSLAERAARGDDARALSAAAARALEAATVVYAEVNVRDARGGEAKTRLVEAGVAEEVAKKVDGVLADCEAARFSPEAPELVTARALWSQAKDAIHALRSEA